MAGEFKVKNGLIVVGDATISGNATLNGNAVATQAWVNSQAYLTTVPTLAQVTTAGATTTNAITVGGLTVATNLLYTDTVNGRVGIGTSSPDAKVDINLGTGNLTNSVYIRNSSSTGYSSITMFDNRNITSYVGQWGLYGSGVTSPNTSNMFFYNSAGGGVGFYVGTGVSPANDLKLLIHSTGNILIGTTTDAGYKLDVAGNTRVNGGNTTSDIPFIVNNRFQFRGDGVLSYGAASAHGRLNWDASGAYFYGLSGYGVGLGANGVLNHLFINTSGNVGIGTTSPSYKFQVQGSVYFNGSTNDFYVDGVSRFGGLNSYSTVINASGQVGIGTTTPGQLLHVRANSAGNNGITIQNVNATGNPQLRFLNAAGVEVAAITHIGASVSNVFFYTSSGGNLLNLVGTNVLIGTTTDAGYKLDVQGTLRTTGLITASGGITAGILDYRISTIPTNTTFINDTSRLVQTPAAWIWHDILAFNRLTGSYETYDGTTWSAATINAELFAQKQDQSIQIINNTTILGARWTFTSGNTPFSQGQWLILGLNWTPSQATVNILVESWNGTIWTTRHTSTTTNSATNYFAYVSDYAGDSQLRITITRTGGGNQFNLSSIKLLSARPGDQGTGSEAEFPYYWNGNRNIGIGANAQNTSKLYVAGPIYATANNDTLVGVDVNPTFSSGSFTGITQMAARFANRVHISNNNLLSFGANTTSADTTLGNGYITSFNQSFTINGSGGTPYFRLYHTTGNLVLQNGGTFVDAGYRLDVQGVLRVNGDTRFTGNSYITAGDFHLDNDRPIRWKDSAGNYRRAMLITAVNDFQFGPVDTGWAGQTYVKSGTGMQFLVNGASGTSINAISINSSANIGIGTTSPASKLAVLNTANTVAALIGGGAAAPGWVGIGTVNSGALPFIQGYNNAVSGTAPLSLNPGGSNVLIGTATDAGYKLDVVGNTRFYSATDTYHRIESSATGAAGTIYKNTYHEYFTGTNYATANSWEVYDLTASAPVIHVSGPSRAVGINKINASYQLDVEGAFRSTQGAYFATTSGFVGVGTTSPAYLLDVNGTVNSLSGYSMNGVAGWTGIINIMSNPPGQQNIDVQGGIIVNVF